MDKPRIIHIGRNRGKARLWVEGKLLVNSGFTAGDTYLLTLAVGRIELRKANIAPAGLRLHKVSGRRDKPIIDINTDALLAVGCESFTAHSPVAGVLILTEEL